MGLPEVNEQARISHGQGAADTLRRRPEAELTTAALLRILMRIDGKIDAVQAELSALKDALETPEFLTVAEAAKVLHRSPYTLRKWLREGKLEGSKTTEGRTGQYLIRRQEIEALLPQECRHG